MSDKRGRHNTGYLHLLLGFAGAYVVNMIASDFAGLSGRDTQIVVLIYFIAFLASFLLFRNGIPSGDVMEKRWMRGI
jgi:hypothetical protein